MQDQPNPPQAPKKATERVQKETASYISAIVDYQDRRAAMDKKQPLLKITTTDQYKNSNWSVLDRALNDLTIKMLNGIAAQKIYHFGGYKPDYSYGDGSILLKEPCSSCVNNLLTVADKKAEREKAERFFANWLKKARKWHDDGCLELSEPTHQHSTSKSKTTINPTLNKGVIHEK